MMYNCGTVREGASSSIGEGGGGRAGTIRHYNIRV